MTELDFGDLDRLIELQDRLGLRDTHFVELARDGFSIAHTDEEREELDDLVDCPLHQWLSHNRPTGADGIYIAYPHEPDAYSEAYRPGMGNWDWTPIKSL